MEDPLMRQKIVAGNWKMNKTLQEAMEFSIGLEERKSEFSPQVSILIAPPALYLGHMEMIEESCFSLAAQNCSQHTYGAFTGEWSALMLKNMNVHFAILGHSERRQYFFETDELIAKKITACLEQDVTPIFCCGETLEQRQGQVHFVTVLHQLEKALFALNEKEVRKVIIAYEPVWAIGTGVTATSEQAQEMHAFIRQSLANHFSSEVAGRIPVLYGGSVNAQNAAELFACPDVDGGLVGGASLKVRDFSEIILAAARA
jgi:triosephosphate isomerase (TIM)